MTLQDKAKEAIEFYEYKKRDDGSEYYCAPNCPEWVQTMNYDAHNGCLPNDDVYEAIYNALEAFGDYDDPEDVYSDIEPHIYTSDLTAWLHSNNSYTEYLDEAMEAGCAKTGDALLQYAHILFLEAIYYSVQNSLESEADDD